MGKHPENLQKKHNKKSLDEFDLLPLGRAVGQFMTISYISIYFLDHFGVGSQKKNIFLQDVVTLVPLGDLFKFSTTT